MEKLPNYSTDIKREVLVICEVFGLGSFLELLTIDDRSSLGYILVQFETNKGRYNHFYRIKTQSINK